MKRRLVFSVVAAGLLTPALLAQFNLNKLSEGLSTLGKAKQTAESAADKAKKVGQVAKGVAGIGPEEERVIGDSVALEIAGKYGGLARDDAMMERINLIGKSLAYYSSRPNLDWRFAVLDSDDVNAFSAPSGYVFVTKGLYALVPDDDSLAAVLSHEIAHITERHALKIVARSEFISGASSLATEYSRDARMLDGQLRQFDTGIKEITSTLFEKGFDPATEYDADKKGRDLATLTGYAPGAFRTVLVKLKSLPASDASMKVFPTHPSFEDRLKKLPADPKPEKAKS
jgi:predicted Zn-dependent protease